MPGGSGWLHEYKYDGYRLLIATGDGVATAWTRNGNDWSDKFKPLVKAAATLPGGCLIDGEAVALGKDGKPSFQSLQAGLKDGKANLAFYAFDLLIDQDEDIRKLPNVERKQRLAALARGRRAADPLRRSCHRQGRGLVRRDLRAARRRDHLQRRPTRLIRASAGATGSRSSAPGGKNSLIVGWSESDKARGFRSLLLAPATAAS